MTREALKRILSRDETEVCGSISVLVLLGTVQFPMIQYPSPNVSGLLPGMQSVQWRSSVSAMQRGRPCDLCAVGRVSYATSRVYKVSILWYVSLGV